MFSAEIVKCSINPEGSMLTTFSLEYPRFIHSEVMTHRVFSRNAMSSRAIPVAKMLEQVRTAPATPVHWGANQPGMQAKAEVENLQAAKLLWKMAAQSAAIFAEGMAELGLHKQVSNRVLEPFQWMRTIVTATDWDNYYELRDHEDADPNFFKLARLMREVQDSVLPVLLQPGQWHLPYVTPDEEASEYTLLELQKISAARCARVSYLTHEGKLPDTQKDLDLFDRLAAGRPLHASPLEHQGTPGSVDTGNFKGWTQFRKVWEKEIYGS